MCFSWDGVHTFAMLPEKLFPAALSSAVTISQLAFWILLTHESGLHHPILRSHRLQGLQSRQRLFSRAFQSISVVS